MEERLHRHETAPCMPFLKWPGGKRWIAEEIAGMVASHLHGTYYEPFLGGGAVFFRLVPPKVVLSDINGELIRTYQTVCASPSDLVAQLKRMQVSREAYERIRDDSPESDLGQAARFLYLNRTAYGGMYRLNRGGRFNVPFGGGGRTPAPLWERDLLARASRALRHAELIVCDFEAAMARAGAGDVVYCDPAYALMHDRNGFIRYNESNFSWADQERLARAAKACSRRGAAVLVSNADHESIRELYPDAEMLSVQRTSRMSRDPKHRVTVKECIFTLRPARPRGSHNRASASRGRVA